MKTILCFGDSNTFGANPADGSRYDRHTRWPGVMRDQLGLDYEVIEEGLGGRTTVIDDPMSPCRNGKDYLIPCLASHQPINLVIIMLGTNDLQARYGLAAFDIARGMEVLANAVRASGAGPGGKAPRTLLVSPPSVLPMVEGFEPMAGAHIKSTKLAMCYQFVARQTGSLFFDAGLVMVSSPVDGVHFDAPEHGKLGMAMAEKVREIFAAG
ncbi:MAG: SGNH/GDSL hydrolase family protein [Phycisphaeraceae bacterium]|nr:SGNH/GDSL hydrolase family protein [Phycisphaeraceae bacterium]